MQKMKLRPIAGGAMRGDCPACGYPDAFTVMTGENGKPLYWCANCRDQDAVLMAMRGLEVDRLPEYTPAPKAFDKEAAALAIWRKGRSAKRTIVEDYLRGRGINLPVPPTLRYVDRARHKPSEKWYPMMVAAVTVWPSNVPTAIHRTYLDEGQKAPVDPAKKTLGKIFGGAVRLAPSGPVMVIGEGIETCLSVQETTGLPAWAALSAGNLSRIVLPETVRHVFIAADNDENGVGMKAANDAASRFRSEGKQVTIAIPAKIGTDFNDCLAVGAN